MQLPMLASFVCVVVVAICSMGLCAATDTPIIGIYTEPTMMSECDTLYSHEVKTRNALYDASCVATVYVKWLEMAGAQVVIVPYDAPKAKLDELFSGINALLYTGGSMDLARNITYYENALYLYQKALKANAAGDYFPVQGTCQGFQLLNIMTADEFSVLQPGFDSEDISMPLNFTSTARQSRMFGQACPTQIFLDYKNRPITSNLHHMGVTPATYAKTAKLRDFFHVLSTNRDRKGREFVSTIEAFSYPVYATQWHPERPQFEWTGHDINHSVEAIVAMQWYANFLISEARKSNHSFAEPSKNLIYNFAPTPSGTSYECYFFPKS